VAEREAGDAMEEDEAARGSWKLSRSRVGDVGARRDERCRLPDEGRGRTAGSTKLVAMAEVLSRANAARAKRTGRLGLGCRCEEVFSAVEVVVVGLAVWAVEVGVIGATAATAAAGCGEDGVFGESRAAGESDAREGEGGWEEDDAGGG
jgi:hypothetical protein